MLRRALPVLALVPLVACGDEDTPPIDVGPQGNPTIAFKVPAADQGPVCISIGEDVDARVPLVTDVQQFVLRPPGSCAQFEQCGHLALYACGPGGCPADDDPTTSPALNNESAVRSIDLLLGKLADRYHDNTLHTSTMQADRLHVRVDVVNDAGALELDHENQPLRAELQLVTIAPPCCGNLAADAMATQSGAGGEGFTPTSWKDGDTEEECVAAGCGSCGGLVDTAPGAWIQYEWESPVTIGSMWLDMYACSSSCDASAIAGGTVEYWDGAAWREAQSFSDQSDDFGLTFDPSLRTTKLRINNITAASCDNEGVPPIVYEWYVYPWIDCR